MTYELKECNIATTTKKKIHGGIEVSVQTKQNAKTYDSHNGNAAAARCGQIFGRSITRIRVDMGK
jgi:hypothetical protein